MGWGQGVWFCRESPGSVSWLIPAAGPRQICPFRERWVGNWKSDPQPRLAHLSLSHESVVNHEVFSTEQKQSTRAWAPCESHREKERRQRRFLAALQPVGHPACPPHPPWDKPPPGKATFRRVHGFGLQPTRYTTGTVKYQCDRGQAEGRQCIKNLGELSLTVPQEVPTLLTL